MGYPAAAIGAGIGMMIFLLVFANAWRVGLLPKDYDFIHDFGQSLVRIDNKPATYGQPFCSSVSSPDQESLPNRSRRSKMKRPFAVTILALLAVIAGLLALVDVLRYVGLVPLAGLGPVDFFGVSIIGAIMAGIAALIWFWVAARLWNLDPQGWMFVVVIAVVYLIFDLLAILGGSSFQAMLPSLIINALALILGILPSTKAAFGQD